MKHGYWMENIPKSILYAVLAKKTILIASMSALRVGKDGCAGGVFQVD